MAEAIDIMNLLNRNGELRKVNFLDSTLKIENARSQSIPFQSGLIPTILALNRFFVGELRSALSVLVPTIRTCNFQLEVHILSGYG